MNSKKANTRVALSALLLSLLFVACGEKPDAMLISAKDYLAKNDNKSAVIQIKNVLQSNPDQPEARYLLGSALLNSGDPVGAETELRKALDLKQPQDMVVPQLAKALLAQGHAKKLIDELARIELSQPSAKASLQMSLTSAYAMQGKPELSQTALNAALQAEPGNASALITQARQKAGLRDFDGAMAITESVIAKSPASYEAWKLKGDILLYAKNLPNDALAAYRKTIEIKPDYLAGHAAAITLLMQQGNLAEADKQIGKLKKSAPNHPQTLYLEAQSAFQKKEFKLARELVQQVLKAAPSNVLGLQLAGVVEFQLNSLPQAEIYLSQAMQAAPDLILARRALVLTHLRLGQPAKAMASLLPGLSRATVDPELLSVAGEVYLQNGDAKKAEEYFTKAAQQNPKDAGKQTALALSHLMSGSSDTAFEELQGIAGSDAGTTADMALISVNLRRQDFDKALKAIDGLEKKQPDKPLAAQLRGRTLLAKKDIAGARKNFERALAIDPSYFPAVASLAGLDMADNKPDEAKKRFEAVLTREPKNSQALLALAELAARSGAGKEEVSKLIGKAVSASPTDVLPHLLLIDFNLRNQDVKAASSAAQNALAALPGSPELLDALGRTQQASGDYNQAIASYNKLAGLQPLLPQPHLRLAEVHMAEKNKDAAVGSLRKALELKPDLLEAQRALVMLDLEGKNFQGALTMARTVQKQRPAEAVGYVLEGDINALQKKWDAAEAAYRTGLKNANASELAVKFHSVLISTGKGVEADKFSASWQKDHPKDAVFLSYLGDVAIARSDYATAEKKYAAVVKLQANNAVAYNNLAWVSAKLNKEGAIAFAEKANALAPNQPAFMDTLAMLLSDKGDYAKAVELQTKALALQPKNAFFQLNLAKIYVKGGEKNLARKELEELKKLGDKFSAQADVALLLTGI
ncbi:MAG: PEP-CTERM system TPR-repeat protein PrsT [Rhodoferax sp.]|uniref:XrtA/PEP-CTERM system TPR-repeat protein PrsT n=1 Tax=Rhodoferax sp. TaxID=50421 RepID=UPI0017964C2A|nr:XrtA/PEP-CTERM system TPR-repeat protein PrsT [Rhodoferax sp.]NMM15522.1 PEP-CTERM system TPR-repeat protein PrsT [Rhodoferax sp.]NMM21319.1 PEP-CTERM system TPR-repeat protein PrsT [Rhodoferax sp.]